jgi:calcineurin-like phosphoesterase family protein
MNYWFTSDTHFGHSNIIKYCNRPFANVDAMDDHMISNWNKLVKPGDIVYHLGDFAFRNVERYINCLPGNIHLIFGNHDHMARKKRDLFDWTGDFKEIKVNGQKIVLCHYALRVWNKSHHGAWHLYGHSHGTLPDLGNQLAFDCGVDCWNYRPINFEEVKEQMQKYNWEGVDHHKPNR